MSGLTGADRSFFYAGGPPPRNEEQINLDFQGGTLINQAAIGQARSEDTIDAYLLNGMPYGWNRSNPNKPTLEFPFMFLRVLKEEFRKDDGRLANTFEHLKNQLPPEMLNRLNEEMALPPGERSSAYSSLNQTLNMTAMLLVWLGQAADPSTISNNALRLALQNLELTTLAMQQLIAQLELFLREGNALIRLMGANHPHYDQMLKFLAEAEEALKLIKKISDEERRQKKKRSKSDEETEDKLNETLDKIKLVVDQIERIHNNYQNIAGSAEMQIFGTLINALTIIAKSQTLNGGLRSILMGLMVSQTENEKGENQASPLGKKIEDFLQTLAKILFQAHHPKPNPGLESFFSLFITFGLVMALTATLYFLDVDAEPILNDEANEKPKKIKISKEMQLSIQTDSLLNLLHMAMEFDLMVHFIDAPQKDATSINKIKTEQTKQGTEFIIIGLILKTIALHDNELSLTLLRGLTDSLERRIKSLEEVLHSTYVGEEKTIISRRQLEKALLHLTDCRISISKNDLTRYYKAYDAFISAFSINMEAFNSELEMFYNLAYEIRICFTKNYKDFSNSVTEVVQI